MPRHRPGALRRRAGCGGVGAQPRYREDALEQIAVEYRPLPPIVDPEAAAWPDAPLLHPAVGSNVISERAFRYVLAVLQAYRRCLGEIRDR